MTCCTKKGVYHCMNYHSKSFKINENYIPKFNYFCMNAVLSIKQS